MLLRAPPSPHVCPSLFAAHNPLFCLNQIELEEASLFSFLHCAPFLPLTEIVFIYFVEFPCEISKEKHRKLTMTSMFATTATL